MDYCLSMGWDVMLTDDLGNRHAVNRVVNTASSVQRYTCGANAQFKLISIVHRSSSAGDIHKNLENQVSRVILVKHFEPQQFVTFNIVVKYDNTR